MSFPDPVSDLESLPVSHQAHVPESYRDEMGHMNIMWYAHLFAESTRHLFATFGMTLDYYQTNAAGTFALEAHTRYLAEVHIGEYLTIRTRTLGRTAKRFHAMHFMTCDTDSRLAATAEVVGTHVDMNTRRSSPFPASVADQIDGIVEAHGQLSWDAPLCGVMRP